MKLFCGLSTGTKRLCTICCPDWKTRNTQAWIVLLGGMQLMHEKAAGE